MRSKLLQDEKRRNAARSGGVSGLDMMPEIGEEGAFPEAGGGMPRR